MPEVGNGVATIEVLPTYEAQREIFDRLGITEGLIQSLDIEVWSRHLEALREGYRSATMEVERGGYRIEGYPVATVSNRELRLGSVTLEAATQIVETASGSRITLTASEDGSSTFRFKTVSAIEDAAFAALHGSNLLYGATDPSGTLTISINELRNVMEEYKAFRNSGRRRDAIRLAIRNNLKNSLMGKTPERKPTEWTKERADKFGEYFSNIRKGLTAESNPFANIDILPHGVLASRWWGIEPEAVDTAGVDTPLRWNRKSDGSLRGLQHESVPSHSGPRPGTPEDQIPRSDHDEDCESRQLEEGCTCGECFFACSCGYEEESRTTGENTQTAEWNSPVLRSYHSRGLEYLCEKLEYRNTNSTAGVHVHVNASDLTPSQVVQVGLIYTALEPLFMNEYKRTTRTYCKEIDLPEFVNRFKQAAQVKTLGGQVNIRNVFSSDRYFTVNAAALSSHGTLEFRAMGPRYNYEFLIRWAHFLREILNMAKAEIPQKAWRSAKSFRDVVLLMAKYGRETPMPSWATDEYSADAVVAKLGTEVRRSPHVDGGSVRTVFDDYTGAVQFS